MTRLRVGPERRALFAAIVIVGTILVCALLAEGGVRFRHWLRYGTPASLGETFRVDAASGLRVPIADRLPSHIRISSLGFRSPELLSPKPPDTIRLAFLGGSSTYCAEVSSNEATWPHLVWEALRASRSRPTFDYVNAGVPGYGIQAMLRTLEHRVKGLRPDVIVIYEATNDLSFESARLARERGLLSARPDEGTWMSRYLMSWFLVEKNLTVWYRQTKAGTTAGKLDIDPLLLSRGFEQRLDNLVRTSQEVAPVVALVTFAPRLRRGQSEDEQRRAAVTAAYYMPSLSIEGLLRGYEEYNRVIRAVAARRSALLIDAADSIPGDSVHYVDSVHFNDAGSRAMAARVSQALLASPSLAVLLAERDRYRAERPGATRP